MLLIDIQTSISWLRLMDYADITALSALIDAEKSSLVDNILPAVKEKLLKAYLSTDFITGDRISLISMTIDSCTNWNASSINNTGSTSYKGMSFSCTRNATLTDAQFHLKRKGTISGNIYAKLYAHSGVYGTSSVPTGGPLAISNPVDSAILPTDAEFVNFTFSDNYEMLASNYYVIVFDDGSTSVDSDNCIGISGDTINLTHSGNYSYSTDGLSWSNPATVDIPFFVIGSAKSNSFVDKSNIINGFVDELKPYVAEINTNYTELAALYDDSSKTFNDSIYVYLSSGKTVLTEFTSLPNEYIKHVNYEAKLASSHDMIGTKINGLLKDLCAESRVYIDMRNTLTHLQGQFTNVESVVNTIGSTDQDDIDDFLDQSLGEIKEALRDA